MNDSDTRLMRYRLIESLVLVASDAEDQVAWMQRTGFPAAELARGYRDWLDMLPRLEERGAVTPETASAIRDVDAAFGVIDTRSAGGEGTPYLWTAESLRQDHEWDDVRRAARSALDGFAATGIPIPKVTDADFNKGPDDAP